MILRKPYAFLIKYFKIIHIIMFIFFTYLVFALRKIYLFFANYVKTSTFTYVENMASNYITPIMFVMVLIILVLAISIFLLMRKKDKPILFYRILIVYSIVLLISLIYFYSFFISLENTYYEPLRIVINRDIILFVYYVNYFYVGFSFIRGFGFDIKKFSFDRDKKELNLEETDNEEYELNIGIDKDNFASYIRKERREFRYYLKENALILSIIGSLLIIILGLYLYYNFFVENKIYEQNEEVVIGKITYRVQKAMLTTLDKYSNAINSKNDFLIIDITINNNSGNGSLDKEVFRVIDNNNYYYPVYNYCNSFDDLGNCYTNQELKMNNSYQFYLVYKLEKTHSEKIYFEILKNKNNFKYERMLLNILNDEKREVNYSLTDDIKIGNDNLQINSYELLENTSFKYEECKDNICNSYTKMVIPRLNEVVLSLNITNLDNVSDIILDNYLGLKYDNVMVSGKDIQIIYKNKDVLYLSVPKNVMDKDNLSVVIRARDTIYNILLRGEENE